MRKDYYQSLGVAKSADEKEIKAAYKRLARKWHPDVNPNNPEAESKFKEVSEAYQVLSDSEKRKLYDAYGADWESGGSAGSQAGANFRYEQGVQNFGDLFEQIFSGFGARSGFQDPGPVDVEQSVEVTLREVDKGASRSLHYQVEDACRQCGGAGMVQGTRGDYLPCPGCSGRGRTISAKKVEIKIPAGVAGGKKLRVPQRGAAGANGKAGDLYVLIRETPDPQFTRHGDDLEVEVEVSYLEAALGGPVRVPTLHSSGTVQIPEGTQNGTKFRLKGQGLTSLKGGKGDLFARVKITVPKRLSDTERELLSKIRSLQGAAK